MPEMKTPPPNSVYIETREALRQWLTENWTQKTGVWLIFNKKASGLPVVTYDEMVEECLCFGWIDSKPGALDELRSMLYIAPRKAGSNWSALNKVRVEKLLKSGLITPPGMSKIELSKKDGTWEALDEVEALVIPQDLADCLLRYEHADENFRSFPKSVKRGILEWILNAKRPETRQKRIEETASLAAKNLRANQWPRAPK